MRRFLAWSRILALLAVGLSPASGGATLSGPDAIIRCPFSDELLRKPVILSVSLAHADIWSDGEAVSPFFSETPMLARCGSGHQLFWVEDADVLGDLGPHSEVTEDGKWVQTAVPPNPDWEAARPLSGLEENDYLDAIDDGLGDTYAPVRRGSSLPPSARPSATREVDLRTRAWQSANDCERKYVPPGATSSCRRPTFPEGSRARANLEALLALTPEEDDYQRLRRAEMLRELGRFEEALSAVEIPVGSASADLAAALREAIERRQTLVLVIPTAQAARKPAQ